MALRPADHWENRPRRSCARIAATATRATSFGARTVPKPTDTGHVPAVRDPGHCERGGDAPGVQARSAPLSVASGEDGRPFRGSG
ncbi:hypothetical protein ACFWOB_32350 [Streptomyces sp. NPDC058420]|uniref:hypothetical protein n=1 Tax=Streptomyces sp. NPDC058420 TaxID=3346489 RepID=UPI003653D81F